MVEEDSLSFFMALFTIIDRFVSPLAIFGSCVVVLGHYVINSCLGILHHELAEESLLA